MAAVAALPSAKQTYAPTHRTVALGRFESIPFGDEQAEPSVGLATLVLVLASALACLPCAVAIGGPRTPAPLAIGLGLAGMLLAGVKVVALAYGTHGLVEDGFPE
jgi:hypothetical protein